MVRIRVALLACQALLCAVFLGCTASDPPERAPEGSATKKPMGSDKRPSPAEPLGGKSATKPFNNSLSQIPGTIEAEDFDEGESNVAYWDLDEKNQGAQDYRGPTQADIEKRDDASGGYGIGWTRKGEWLVYSVSVQESGTYNLEIPVASEKQGGTFHLEFDGENVTGPIEVPDTGGWGTLQTISREGLPLSKGVQTMKLVMDSEGPSGSIGDIDCLRFTAATE